MSDISSRLRAAAAGLSVALGCALLLAGCAAASSQQPNSATAASAVPGAAPSLGDASTAGISVSAAHIVRTGTALVIAARIHNSGTTPDELLQIGSQVSATITLSPPLTIPAGGTVSLGGAGSRAVLDQQGRLEPGATVDLSLQFQQSGSLQVFTSFTDS